MISAFKQLVFNPVQTGCLPITDRGVSRGLLYISERQAPPTSNRRGFQLRRRENFNAQASLTKKKMKRSFEYTWSSDEEEEDDDLYRAMEEWERKQQVEGATAAAVAPLFEYTWSSDEENDILLKAMDEFEQQVGGAVKKPLFEFDMTIVGPRKNWKNLVNKTQFRAQLRQVREPVAEENIANELTEALYQAINRELHREDRHPNDWVNFSITAQGFEHAYQSVNFQVREFLDRSLRLHELLDNLAGKLNSNESFDHNQSFMVEVVFVKRPRPGSGKKNRNVGLRCLDKDNKRKKCIISINNNDDLCCARAIATMIAHAHKDDSNDAYQDYRNIIQGRKIQEEKAIELHELAEVQRGPCGWEELQKFQHYLQPTYQLIAMCRTKPFFPFFKGPPADIQIKLIKSDTHYDGCSSFAAFVNRAYWCNLCDRGYNVEDAQHHSCDGRKCNSCSRNNCPDYDRINRNPSILCNFCHCSFYGNNCFDYHREKNQCAKHRTCLKCYAQYNVIKGKRHRCGFASCSSCKQMVEIHAHKCFMQPVVDHPEKEDDGDGTKKPLPPPLLIYADIEALQLPDRQFEENLLCYRTSESDTIVTHKGKDCVNMFLHDLDDAAEIPDDDRQRTIITIFHNLKGFDGTFIIQELYKQQRGIENQLTVGSKVLSFESGPLIFKDSLCFLPMPLANFPSAFNLTELKKGFFPHLFNTPDNQAYKGRIPDLEYFDPDGMSEQNKTKLEEWHEEEVRRGVQYDFAKEMQEYCASDVALLQAGCEAFTKEFQSNAGFNPFISCVTIASACHLFWRKHCLKEETIAVEPINGWRGRNVNHSIKALQWLYYKEHCIPKQGVCPDRIKHVKNGGEQRVTCVEGCYFVDGYDPQTQTVYEFNGCFWHGCPRCHPRNRHARHAANPDRTMEELWRATLAKEAALRLGGYTLEVMWECDWDALTQHDPAVKQFVTTLQLVEPLQPRQAFFGGRTGAVALHAKAEDGEEIRYVDVTSLYPWVNKNAVYPIGHPTILTQPRDQNIAIYFGIALVDIIPPANLFHPVLPVRSGTKLTFPLCAACVKNEQSKEMLERSDVCNHTPEERMLRGTWCTPEIEKAVEKGYRVVRIHEVWHFPPHQQQEGLFRDYVNTWLKLKQQSTGWPRWCDTEAKKQQYLTQYKEREGIDLDYASIQKNAGQRQVAKLMMNSFWGKFGQRQNKPRTVTITSPSQLFPLLFNSHTNLTTLRICTDDVLEAVYTELDENVVPSNKTNVLVAAFTTAWARLKLYEALDHLQQQVLYYDTDSVIYRWKPGQPSIPIGDYLGQFTDELQGDVITEFISGGAKNYSYKTRQGKTECKVRGFSLNVRGKQELNFNTMKATILSEIEHPQEEMRVIRTVNPNHFQRDTTNKSIKLVHQVKNYKLVFDKRVLDPQNKMSYPFGYRTWSEVDDENVDMLLDL